jgi:hypothetical protein
MEDFFYKYTLERCVNQILESHACHSFAIAKTWQRSVGFKEAGIVDRPSHQIEDPKRGNARYLPIHALAPSSRPVQGPKTWRSSGVKSIRSSNSDFNAGSVSIVGIFDQFNQGDLVRKVPLLTVVA